jgi:hypothetical protein
MHRNNIYRPAKNDCKKNRKDEESSLLNDCLHEKIETVSFRERDFFKMIAGRYPHKQA